MSCRTMAASALVFLFSLASGCATITRGNRQTVEVVTDPPGATVEIDGKILETPAKVLVKRKQSYDVTLTKEGHQSIHFKLRPRWDAGGAGAVAWNIIVPGGTIMFLIDTLAGADRNFNKMQTIILPPATAPTTQVVALYEHKGQLFSKEDYDAAVERDKLFGKKSRKDKKSSDKRPATETAR